MPERGPAGEVLQGHPVGPLVDQPAEAVPLGRRHVVQGEEPAAGHPEDVGEQQFGVHPW